MSADEGSYFRTAVRFDGLVQVVDVSGELDLAGLSPLADACFASNGVHVVVDMTDLIFMDCGGYGGLVAARNRVEAAGGSLKLRGAVAEPARLLALIKRIDPPTPHEASRPLVGV